MPAELDVSISGTDDFERASAALAGAEDRLPEDIRKEIRGVADRLANIARRRVLEEPTHGPKHTGLRAEISAGVSVLDESYGAKISTSVPQTDEAIIPRGLDAHGWRHPVFGSRSNWVDQHGAFSWFMDSMQGARPDGEANLERLLEETAERIAQAS